MISLFSFQFAFSQVENVIVETYYISDSLDATDTTGGRLEIGSITYRVYVDLAPGTKLRKIYGDQNHPLKISSSDFIFNNTADGLSFAKDFSKTRLRENTVALDSWLTLGQTTRIATKTYFGVLKRADVSGSFIGGINSDGGSEGISGGLLTNNNPDAGIPLTMSDGMDTMTTIPTSWADYGFVNDVSGVDSTIFGSKKQGTEFVSYDAALQNSGVSGVNPDSNQVLIAQITTKGDISFEFNIEVEVPAFPNPVIVKYVSVFADGETNSDTVKLSPFLKYPASCGCVDASFLEYNASFTCNNVDSCKTKIVFGCTDTLACNYDPNSNFNLPGLCCYPGNCSDRDISMVCPELSIGRSSSQFVNLHPNPVNNELIFQFTAEKEKEYKYSVYNSIGELVLENSLGVVSGYYVGQINLGDLVSGIYFFILNDGATLQTSEIIKK